MRRDLGRDSPWATACVSVTRSARESERDTGEAVAHGLGSRLPSLASTTTLKIR